jgi:YidC/Oxa1 family membrane protein insertase
MTQFNMVESPQGPDPKRLLLAIVLTSAVLMTYSYFFAPTPQPMATKDAVEQPKAVEKKPEAVVDAVDVVHEQATPAVAQKKSNFLVTENEHSGLFKRTSYDAEVVNLGGVLSKYALTDFSDPRIIIDQEKLGSSLIKISLKKPLSLAADAPFEIVHEDKTSIKLRHVTKEGLAIERDYQFLDQARIREQITFKNLSSIPVKVEPIFSATKVDEKGKEPGFLNPGVDGQYVAVKTAEKYQRLNYTDLKDKQQSFSNIKYVAFDDQFFLTAMVPDYSNAIDHVDVLVREEGDNKKVASFDLTLSSFVLMGGEEKLLTHQFFIGPKQIGLLSSFTVPLDENIDFGWFGVLSRPMLWLLVQIFVFVKNYGLAIIIITLIIKLLTYPLTQKSFSSQQEMKKLQPKVQELQKKFGHDRTLLGQKQMDLYRAHGVNPVAGCLPLLIQLPIWFAFFQMLRNSVELFDQPFYWWITDLTRPDQYFVLPVLMGVSMLIQQAFTPPPTDQPHMKYVMWAMPIFLTFVMLNMPSGLSLYILTNNLLTIGQQIIIKKRSERVKV